MHIVAFVVVALILAGLGLMGWAYFNPKWQGAESYDALLPFVLGLYCLAGALVVAFISGLVWLIRWF